jgi:hypothetical protein
MLVAADVRWLLFCATACGNKVHSLQQLPDLQAQPLSFFLLINVEEANSGNRNRW